MMYRFLASLILIAGIFAQVPDNDRCIQREILKPYEPVDGDVTEANFDYNNQGVCGPRSDRPSLWYEVRGRDDFVTVKVCTNNDIITDFGVFTECNTQLCLGAPSQVFEPASCQEGNSTDFRWFAEEDTQYFVHVRSDRFPDVNGTLVGSNFTIVYEDESLEGPEDDDTETLPPTEGGGGGNGNGNGDFDGAFSPSIALTITSAILSSIVLFV